MTIETLLAVVKSGHNLDTGDFAQQPDTQKNQEGL